MPLSEQKEQLHHKNNVLIYLAIILSTILLQGGASYFYAKEIGVVLESCMFAIVCSGCIIFCITQDLFKKTLHYDNAQHLGRFTFFYACSLILSCIFPMLPYYGWIFPVIALTLSLFSNSITGIITTGYLLCYTCMFSNVPHYTFYFYFLISTISVILFEQLDENYETGLRLFIIMSVYASFLFGSTVFMAKGDMNIELFLIPFISLFVNYILFSCVLHLYSVVVVHRQKNIYLMINDQEYELIKQFKEKDSDAYYHAIHTSYFCEKIARTLHMNIDIAKAGGYYHKLMPMIAKEKGISIRDLCDEHEFPEELKQLLLEYSDKQTPIRMKETTLVIFADTVVSSIMYLFQKNKNAELDYPKIIEAIFLRKKESGILNNSDISIRELRIMEQIFAGENLYYDFLR